MAWSSSARELVARLLRPHQLGREVVPGLAAAQLAELVEIDARHLGVAVGLVELLAAHRHRLEDAAVDVAAGQERRAVLFGNAQHVADHDHRQAVGEVAHDVHAAAVDHPVELGVDQRLDARPHVGDAAGGEGLGHQSAQARMVGRVEHQHGAAEAGDGGLLHAGQIAVAAFEGAHEILAEPLVAQRKSHVVVARDQPQALRRLEDRRRFAKPAIEWIGIGDEGRVERIELERRSIERGRGHIVHGAFLSTNLLAVRTNVPLASAMFALTQGLRRAVQIKPNGTATHFAGRHRTWQQSLERISRVAGAISALGVRPGERVAILALNSDRYFELLYAIPWMGAAMVPLNTRLATPELEYILSDSGASALFIDTAMSHHLNALEGKMSGVREVVWMDDTSSPEGMLRYEDLANYEAVDDAGADDDDLAGLFYTGGTTGRAKGVMLTHSNLVVNALNGVAGIGFTAETTYIHSGPMFHLADGASTFGVTMSGGRHAFVPRFEPVEVLQTIQTEKVTHAQFVPTMINMLVNHPRFGEFDISTLSFILYGASPMPEGVLRKAMQVMPHVRLDACLRHDGGGADRDPARSALHDARRSVRRQVEIVRPVGARLRDQGGRCRPQGGGLRNGGRTRDSRRQHHEGILEQAGGDRGRARERLVLLRRRRHHG